MINKMQENGTQTNRIPRSNESLTIDDFDSDSSPKDTKLFCCKCIHKRRASPITCFAVCFLVLTYNLLGGFFFLAIEGPVKEETAVAATKPNLSQAHSGDIRIKTVERLWSITEDLNILYKENWTKLAAKELMDFQLVLLKSIKDKDEHMSLDYGVRDYRWNFAGSFLYALTLMTTIGHGAVTPKTTIGKLVAIAYACIGIPLVMVYISTVGEALARHFRSLYSKICPTRLKNREFHSKADCQNHYINVESLQSKNDRQKRTPFEAALNLDNLRGGYHWTCRDHTRVPIVLSLLLIVLYVALGSYIFQVTEKWNFLEGCYFSFLSLATIGFGNLRPGSYASTMSSKAEDIALGVCCLYILIGVIVSAMCFNLIKDDISPTWKRLTLNCYSSPKSRTVYSAPEREQEDNIAMSIIS